MRGAVIGLFVRHAANQLRENAHPWVFLYFPVSMVIKRVVAQMFAQHQVRTMLSNGMPVRRKYTYLTIGYDNTPRRRILHPF